MKQSLASKGLRKVYAGIAVFVLVILGASFVYEAVGGWTFIDSLYTVVILVFGVGYGDVHPMTPMLKVFTMGVIVVGASTVVYIVGGFVRLITQGELQRTLGHMKKTKSIEDIHDHAIICGYGRIGQILAHELTEGDFPFIVVDTDADRIALAEGAGYLCIRGSATEEDSLLRAGIERAKVLATVLPNDALNVFITLTARNLNRDLRIVARGEQPATEKKLRQAGANEVVLPAAIGGMRIANSITRPSIMHFLGDVKGLVGHDLKCLGLEVSEIAIEGGAEGYAGRTAGEVQQGQLRAAALVLAVKLADGRILKSGFDAQPLAPGDVLVVVGRSDQLARAPGAADARAPLL